MSLEAIMTPLGVKMAPRCSRMLCNEPATKSVLVPFCESHRKIWLSNVRSGRVIDQTKGAVPG